MGKFKVGDKVKVRHTDYRQFEIGDVTHIVHVDDDGADLYCDDVEDGLYFYDWEFDVVNEAPKFAVGDRVRLIKSDGYNGYGEYGKTGEKGTVVQYTDYDDNYEVDFDESGRWWAYADNLEPVAVAPQQQPLTVRAGRYYKTRDGRKVGPMEAWRPGSDFQWESAGYLWKDDGESYDKDSVHTIIAEWTDEPAATNADIFDELEDWMADNPLPVIDTSTTGFTVPLDAPEFGGKLDATAPTLDDLYAAKCMVETGVCTINEVRKHLGLGPVPRGHELARAA